MKLFVFVFLALSISCFAQKKKIPPIIPTGSVPTPPIEKPKKRLSQTRKSIEEKLKYYFYGREIVPSVIVNNTERDQTEIKLENNIVNWIRSEKEIKVKINGDLFTLKNQKTLNNVNGKMGDVDFANRWDQIKLFKFGDREVIGIKMDNDPCTGIGCRVAIYLIYDLKTKSKNFFGTYRFLLDREFGLYNFKDDGNDGKGIEFQNIYEIFTMDEAGNFHLRKDNKGNKYFMKRVYKEDNYEELDRKFEQYWIEEIK